MKKATLNKIKKWASGIPPVLMMCWRIPQVQSVILTRLIQIGVPSAILAAMVAIFDALSVAS